MTSGRASLQGTRAHGPWTPPARDSVVLSQGASGFSVFGDAPNDRGFSAMWDAYQDTGGIMRGDDLGHLQRDRQRGDVSMLARSIVSFEVFGFYWRHDFWVPMCQFDTTDLSVKPWPRQLRSELPAFLDGWLVAAWLVEPHARLANRRPVDLLESRLMDVLKAARSSRFTVAA